MTWRFPIGRGLGTKHRIEEQVIALIGQPITAIVGQHHNRPRPHPLQAARTALALQESRGISWRLVLNHAANPQIVETHFERRCRDNDVTRDIDTDILGTRARDRNRRVAKVVSDLNSGIPHLPISTARLRRQVGLDAADWQATRDLAAVDRRTYVPPRRASCSRGDLSHRGHR